MRPQPIPIPAKSLPTQESAPKDPPPRPKARRSSGRLKALGAHGERVAARHLMERGLVLLDRNWRCSEGEVDLVLQHGAIVVFCEVKTRSTGSQVSPHQAISPAKLERMWRVAIRWMEAHRVTPKEVRLDLVAVVLPQSGSAHVEHVAGVG